MQSGSALTGSGRSAPSGSSLAARAGPSRRPCADGCSNIRVSFYNVAISLNLLTLSPASRGCDRRKSEGGVGLAARVCWGAEAGAEPSTRHSTLSPPTGAQRPLPLFLPPRPPPPAASPHPPPLSHHRRRPYPAGTPRPPTPGFACPRPVPPRPSWAGCRGYNGAAEKRRA